jgi:trehalose 6-phosphate phosphatase
MVQRASLSRGDDMTVVAATRPVLAAEASHDLGSFALSNVLLAFDYDGTLAPIAASPARARLRSTTSTLLRRVATHYPCVVISGRALADISQRLQKIPLWYVFGNHGSEPAVAPAPVDCTSEWLRVLRSALPADSGIVIEDKDHSIAVHYRRAPDPEGASEAIMRVAATLPGARVVGGRKAVNLLRRDAPDKGSALKYAMRAFACDVAMYVGDDDTDEDAFRALPPERLLGIHVGRAPAGSHARFHLQGQRDIDLLLQRLLALRAPTR